MSKKRRSTNQYLVGGVAVALLILSFVAVGGFDFNIARTVQDHTYPTVDEALAACEQQRAINAADGQECDVCRLVCPSGAQDGTHDWNNDGTINVEFDPALCDLSQTALGNLLEARSYCGSTIRLCEEQASDATVTGTWSVANGEIRELTYTSWYTYCDSGVRTGDTATTTVAYELICSSGYYVDGRRLAGSQTSLGRCVSPDVIEGEQSGMDAFLGSVTAPRTVDASSNLQLRGTADVTGGTGTYVIHARLEEVEETFSVVTGRSAVDQCGNDPHAASVFLRGGQGDVLAYILDVQMPSLESGARFGSTNWVVEVLNGCGGEVLASRTGSLRIEPREVDTESPKSYPIHDEDGFDQEGAASYIKGIAGSSCSDGEEFEFENCLVAACVDGVVERLDPMICSTGDSTNPTREYRSPAEVIADTGDTVRGSPSGQRGWWSGFVCWLVELFGGVCTL